MAYMPSRKPTYTTYDVATYKGPFADTIAAVRRSDQASWDTADSVNREVARDAKGRVPKSQWDALAAALKATGTAGSAETLRAYSRVSGFWPVADRVQGLGFTHHRRAMAIGDLGKAKALLARLVKDAGGNPADVAERDVDIAVGAETGKVRSTRTKAKATQVPAVGTTDPVSDVLRLVNETLTAPVLKDLDVKRLGAIVTVLGSRVAAAQKLIDRATKAPAKVGTKAPATKAPAKTAKATQTKAPAKVGMR